MSHPELQQEPDDIINAYVVHGEEVGLADTSNDDDEDDDDE